MSGIQGLAARAAEIIERIGPGEQGEPTSTIHIDRLGDDLVMAHVTPSATLDARLTSRLLAMVADTVASEACVGAREVHCASSHPDDGLVFTYLLVATIRRA